MRRVQAGVSAALVIVGLWTTTAFGQSIITVTTLQDKADSPFNAGGFCGTGTISNLPVVVSLREAIIAANNTSGPKTITFAPSLSGGTININFRRSGADTTPDPLPSLCGGNTTISGDLNGDNIPDITLNGSALPTGSPERGNFRGIRIISSRNTVNGLAFTNFADGGIDVASFTKQFETADNVVSYNTVTGGNLGILVFAGSAGGKNPVAGITANTTVIGNTISGTKAHGIMVFTGDADGSSVRGTTITKNKIRDNAGIGIFAFTFGSNSSITNTSIRDNEVFGNISHGIASWSFTGRNNSVTGLVVDRNKVHDNSFTGIAITGGICGGSQNTMEATISQNTLMRNGPSDGTSGIYAAGGVSSCTSDPPAASQNQLTVTITKNTLIDNLGAGIGVIVGQVRAESNTVTPTITDNTVTSSGTGIFVGGGVGSWRTFSGPANNNTVNATTFSGNRVESTRVGIGLAGGLSGRANSNIVNAQLQGNISCGAGADIYGVGGFLGSEISPPNQGTGNQVTGRIANNTATAILVKKGFRGNAISVQQQGNTRCSGPPVSVPVVLVHGWGGNAEICTNPGECTFGQMEALLEQNGFVGRVYVYDYSSLTACRSPATIEQIAGDFWRWLGSSEGPGRGRQIDVVAHSMGGLVVRTYALPCRRG